MELWEHKKFNNEESIQQSHRKSGELFNQNFIPNFVWYTHDSSYSKAGQ